MMRRGVGRGGRGVVGAVARTAVVAGTATVVSKGVSGAMDSKAAQQQAAAQQQQQSSYDAGYQQAQMQAQMQAQQAAAPAATSSAITDNTIAQLQKLAELQTQGLLTPEEVAQQKARILGN